MKRKNQPDDYELRSVPGTVEVRENAAGEPMLRGLGVVFDSMSENLGGFREVIKPGALDETDMSDVRGLFNHDSNFVLGRNRSDTMRLNIRSTGLEYEIDMPAGQTQRDLVLEPIKRGDISGSSFGFIVGRGNDDWDENDEGVLIRTISKIRKLFDVGPVTFPAYRESTAGVRSMEQWREEREQVCAEVRDAHSKKLQELDRRDRAAFLGI